MSGNDFDKQKGIDKLRESARIAKMDVIEAFTHGSEDIQRFVRQLQNRDSAINSWFKENPERLQYLVDNPQKTIEDLLQTIGLTPPTDLHSLDLKRWKAVPVIPKPPAGSFLLRSMWEYVAQNEANTTHFITKPFDVVNTVAAVVNASSEEKQAVTHALRQIFGTNTLANNPAAALQVLTSPAAVGRVTMKRIT